MLSVLVVFAFSATPVNGAQKIVKNENAIYFSVPVTGENAWKNYDTIYCHMWKVGYDEYFTWQTSHEKCTRVKGNLWKYDLDNLDYTRGSSGELQSGYTYAVIFSDNLGDQTYDLYFTVDCIGDTVECTSKTMSNPVDTSIKCLVATWKNNGDKYSSTDSVNQETSVSSSNDYAEESEDNANDTLISKMNITIIVILSTAIVILVVILLVKALRNKKRSR